MGAIGFWNCGPNGPFSRDCAPGIPLTPKNCPLPDPGIISTGSFAVVLDYRFRPYRLANGSGGLMVNQIDSSGNGNIIFSLAPNVAFTQYPWGLNAPITGMLAALGDQGTMNRLQPTVAGFVQTAADGTFFIGPVTATAVPDPLTIGTINVTNLNSGPATFGSTVTLTGLPTDTIATSIGLNASNALVKGTALHTSLAMYFENATRTTVASPNSVTTASAPLVIGNELFDPDGIAHVQDVNTIVIDQAGTYRVDWGGWWNSGGQGGAPANSNPGIYLAHNSIGSIASWGNTFQGVTSSAAGCETTGTNFMDLAVNDKLYLIAAATRTASAVKGVSLCLSRVGP